MSKAISDAVSQHRRKATSAEATSERTEVRKIVQNSASKGTRIMEVAAAPTDKEAAVVCTDFDALD